MAPDPRVDSRRYGSPAAGGDGRAAQLNEALDLRPVQLARSGLQPAQARVCLTITEANIDETVHRHVEHFWAVVDGGWVHTYDLESQHWMSWPRECVHWIEWVTPGQATD